ncbi:MAG: DUF1501 domain-containing protein [Acidobacteria bacterium]|nr:DUF1501 domain-containing protein [Acidobacteriota bacterium]MBI3425014.1 DUF1501 domain-containing protein [Acidobacteriota bacterium]
MLQTRRTFLRHSTCAALSAASASTALVELVKTAAAAAPAQGGDYKALVCVFLYGGNDGHNTLVPRTQAEYNGYAAARRELALPLTGLLPLTVRNGDGRAYGLHPSLPELQTLFNQGKLAVLANVGPLAAPVSKDAYKNGTATLPPQLFSHSDQQVHWQTAWPDQPARTGWGGRLADALNALNQNAQVSMSVSLGGTNTFQVGHQVTQYQCPSEGPLTLDYYTGRPTDVISTAIRNTFYQPTRANLLEEAWNGVMRRALDAGAAFRTALAGAPVIQTAFPNTNFGKQLKMAARLIGARNTLNLRRQVFFVTLDGFDTHGDQLASHTGLLQKLSQGLKAFYDATVELGVAHLVTAFTASDFGRAAKPNGQGSDHGWGNHHFILGGGVRGGELFGRYPNLALDGPDDAGAGRLIPTTAVDEYAATLATWFGVGFSELPTVLPNIGRFATRNLGFMY